MRIFLIGGTGHIGTAVVHQLSTAGHKVTALVRSESRIDQVLPYNVTPHPGDMTKPETYRAEASRHDVLIQLGFSYGEETAAADRTALETLLQSARTSSGPAMVIYTSGTYVLGDTGQIPAAENASTEQPAAVVRWRPAHEKMVLQAGDERVATVVIRPGMVYGGSGALTAKLFESAERDGAALLVGDGRNWWSMVHRDDLARLYLLVIESRAQGIFHGVDGQPVRAHDVAAAASQAAGGGGNVRTWPVPEARKKLGALADALAMNSMVITSRSGEVGWTPQRASFIEHAEDAYREWKAKA